MINNFKMRTFSFRKKKSYTVNQTKESDPVCTGMKDLSLGDRKVEERTCNRPLKETRLDRDFEMKDRRDGHDGNGCYNNIPRIHMAGSCGEPTCGPTQAAHGTDGVVTSGRKTQGATCAGGSVSDPTESVLGAARAGHVDDHVGSIPGSPGSEPGDSLGLSEAGWTMSSCESCAVVSHGGTMADYESIKDLRTARPDEVITLRQRLASTSSSSGVSSASEKSVASSFYASVKAIWEKGRKNRAHAPINKMAAPQQNAVRIPLQEVATPEVESEMPPGNVVSISTKRTKPKSKWTMRRGRSVKSPKAQGKPKKSARAKSPQRRKRRRVVALARGLGCVGGARSRSVTPERHQMHRIHQLSPTQREDLNLMLKNVQQRVRTIIDEGRDAINGVNEARDDVQRKLTYDVTNPPAIPARPAALLKQRAATLGSDVTGRRLSRWEQHVGRRHSPPDLSDVAYKRAHSLGRFAPRTTDIQKRPLPPIPDPPREGSVSLVKTLDLSGVMKNSWISGVAVNSRREEVIVVDLEQAYVLDLEGNLKRIVSNRNGKSSARLKEPIDVCVLSDGTMVFSDHADRQVKLFSTRGQHLRSIHNQCHVNIAGVACNAVGEIFVAGTDSGCVSVYGANPCPLRHIPQGSHLEHPYSVAVNPLTGSVIVGDDYKQLVIALSDTGKVLWRFCPSGERHFFPSSISVDNEGYVFIADLYNEKVYMLDSGGKLLKTLLSKGQGLHGGPGAIATDGKGNLYVADREKSLKVFRYGQDGFALYRRCSVVRK